MTARHPYFARLQRALHAAEIAGPWMVIDRTRLDENLKRVKQSVPAELAIRVVAKSLPSPRLLAHVSKALETDRFMTFNLPMLQAIAREFPNADQMLGKPLLPAALKRFLRGEHDPSRVQWLADTPQRLAAMEMIAAPAGATLRVALEINVGLERGGFEPGPEFRAALETLQRSPSLSFSGLMGYEPHLTHLPDRFGLRKAAQRESWSRYRKFLEIAAETLGAEAISGAVRNIGGSPTFRLYKDDSLGNEVALGSCLVKPTDFDLEPLADLKPACFIAAPVLKTGKTALPGLGFADPILNAIAPSSSRTVFLHGGDWRARPVDPPGLRNNKIFGRSPNQEMLNGGRDLALKPGELVFLRPHKSEAVLLQFGDLAIYDGEKIAERWPVYYASA